MDQVTNIGRILIPTWRLFNRPMARLELQVDGVPFLPAPAPAPAPRWYALMWNPQGNLQHAYDNLLQRFVDEAASLTSDEMRALVSYQLLHHLTGGRDFQVVVK